MPTMFFEYMGVIFEWDNDKEKKVIADHKITFYEACSVFSDENEFTFEDTRFDYDEQRFVTIGMSDKAKLLAVSWTYRDDNIRLITAVKAEIKYERLYQRRH